MAVVKNKRSHYTKRQQQQVDEARQKFISERLNPENASAVPHDESDTISFRSYMLRNFHSSAINMNVLLSNNKTDIAPPMLKYNKSVINESNLDASKKQLKTIVDELNNLDWKLTDNHVFLKEKTQELNKINLSSSPAAPGFDENDEAYNEVLDGYLSHYNLRHQTSKVIFHSKEKFSHIKLDSSEAPEGYWTNLYLQKKNQELQNQYQLKIKQEEQLKRKQELEKHEREQERLRRKNEEQQRELELERQKLDAQERQKQHIEEESKKKALEQEQQRKQKQDEEDRQKLEEQQKQQEDDPDQQDQDQQQTGENLDNMFEDFGNEPFNNGFDEEFDDLGSAFF